MRTQALFRALDGLLTSAVSRTAGSRHSPTFAEGWSAQRDRPERGFAPFEFGDDRRAPGGGAAGPNSINWTH